MKVRTMSGTLIERGAPMQPFTLLRLGTSRLLWYDKHVIAWEYGAMPVGTILGRVTANGRHVPCNPLARDGSQDPVAVLAEPVAAGWADVSAMAYGTGEFNAGALVFHHNWSPEALQAAMARRSMFFDLPDAKGA